MGSPIAPPPSPRFDIATLVPSQRDFLQAVRTGREGLALVPCLSADNAGREALRMVESGASALAMSEPSPAMAEASLATRVPVMLLRLVTSRDEGLAARAFGADAVIVDPKAPDPERRAIAESARSVHMAALVLTTTREEVERHARLGARALVVKGPSVAAIQEQIAGSPRLLAIAWLTPEDGAPATSSLGGSPEDDVRALRGLVDAAIVGVDVYGATGFERLVSELSP
jgi:NAD(P)H-dependent flavin oxidoreductase YrpB (nitropropane dioxygenase family)